MVTALTAYSRHHVRRLGPLSREDLEDLAAQKALDLLRRCEAGEWRVHDRSGLEIAGFLSTVARNGVIDRLRKEGPRRIDPKGSPDVVQEAIERNGAAPPDPAHAYEAIEFASQLAHCVRCLSLRARMVWFLRVFFEWPSTRIADHPDVRITPAHVDVEFQRSRQRVRSCMRASGFDAREVPAGAFAEVWRVLFEPALHEPRPSESRKVRVPK